MAPNASSGSGREAARLFVTITAEIKDLKSKLDAADRRWDKTVRNTQNAARQIDAANQMAGRSWAQSAGVGERAVSRLSAGMKNAERAAFRYGKYGLGVLTGAIVYSGVKSVQVAGQYEQARVAFTKLLGSAKKARGFISQMQKFAAQTPFEFREVQEYGKKLLAMGFSAREIIPTMTTLGNAVSAVGGSGETLGRLVLALSQVRAKGKVMSQEMNQFAESGIGAWGILSKGMGKSVAELMEMTGPGGPGIKAAKAVPILLAGLNKKFGGMMKLQSSTMLGMWSNFKDKLGYLMADIGDEIIKRFDLKNRLGSIIKKMGTQEFKDQVITVVETIANWVNGAARLTESLYRNRDAVKELAMGVMVLYGALKLMMIAGSVGKTLGMLGVGASAASAAMGVGGAAGLAGTAAKSGAALSGLRIAGMAAVTMLGGPYVVAAAAAAVAGYALWRVYKNQSDGLKSLSKEEKVSIARYTTHVAAQVKVKKAVEDVAFARDKLTVAIGKYGAESKQAADAQRDLAAAIKERKEAEAEDKTSGPGDAPKKRVQSILDEVRAKAQLAQLSERESQLAEDIRKKTSGRREHDFQTSQANVKKYTAALTDLVNQYDAGKISGEDFAKRSENVTAALDMAKGKVDKYKRELAEMRAEYTRIAEEERNLRAQMNAGAPKPPPVKNNVMNDVFLGSMSKSQVRQKLGPVDDKTFIQSVKNSMSKAKLMSTFGTNDINAILRKAGFININGKWVKDLTEQVEAARAKVAEAAAAMRAWQDAWNAWVPKTQVLTIKQIRVNSGVAPVSGTPGNIAGTPGSSMDLSGGPDDNGGINYPGAHSGMRPGALIGNLVINATGTAGGQQAAQAFMQELEKSRYARAFVGTNVRIG